MNGKEIDGRAVRINYSQPRPPREEGGGRQDRNAGGRDARPKSDPTDTLFVGGLSYNITEDEVYEAFGDHGDVQSVRLPTDRETGAPKGFGYVQFSGIDGAKKAMEAMQGAELSGRYLKLG